MFVEEPVEFTIPLTEQTTYKGQSLTLKCELSKDIVAVTWLKGNARIKSCKKYEMKSDGCVHSLTVHDIDSDDEADYTVVVGEKESTAYVMVEGL